MPAISSSTLFHFTNKENILGILRDDFYPRFHLEDFQLGGKISVRFGIPMVSFCDIPLSLASSHMKKYGKYGIGMSKKWAERNNLNPILYFREGSEATKILRDIYKNIAGYSKDISKDGVKPKPLTECFLLMEKLLTYIKPFDRHNPDGGLTKYYDEREWRYVPDSTLHNSLKTMLTEEEFKEPILSEENEKLKIAKLNFQPNDINYIIIKGEEERLDLIEKIEQIKSGHLTDIRKVLLSKMISAEQIRQDF
jgi:hypothetical protein